MEDKNKPREESPIKDIFGIIKRMLKGILLVLLIAYSLAFIVKFWNIPIFRVIRMVLIDALMAFGIGWGILKYFNKLKK